MANTATAPRSTAQNRRMWGLAKEITALVQLDPELEKALAPAAVRKGDASKSVGERWLRVVVKEVSGQVSSSSLSQAQAEQVCGTMERARESLKEALPGVRQPRAESTVTPYQLEYIEKLCVSIGRLNGRYADMASSPARMRQWCEHYLKMPWPQIQTDADICIEALKSVLSRELPSTSRLKEELKELAGRRDELARFGQELVKDGLKRSRSWGPYQWFKLHEQYQNLTWSNSGA